MEKFNEDVSVIFPAHNEEENIELCVLTAHCILKELVRDFEIIVVNDGSTDMTQQVCFELEKKIDRVHVLHKDKNEGYGYALRDGFRAARFNLIFFSGVSHFPRYEGESKIGFKDIPRTIKEVSRIYKLLRFRGSGNSYV
jgi:glycosyltransferase involved in cell wall biosynthesis